MDFFLCFKVGFCLFEELILFVLGVDLYVSRVGFCLVFGVDFVSFRS